MNNAHDKDLWNQPDEGDPLVWLRKHRDANAKKYATVHELMEYINTVPKSTKEILANLDRKIEEKRRKGYCSTDLYIEDENR